MLHIHSSVYGIRMLLISRLLTIPTDTSLGICLNIFGVYIPRSVTASSKDIYIFILVSSAKFAFQKLTKAIKLSLCMKANTSLHSSTLDTMLLFVLPSTIMNLFFVL